MLITKDESYTNKEGVLLWKLGSFMSKYGIVRFYQQGYNTNDKILTMTLILNKRSYHRTIYGKVYTDLGISRKCAEFARNVINK